MKKSELKSYIREEIKSTQIIMKTNIKDTEKLTLAKQES